MAHRRTVRGRGEDARIVAADSRTTSGEVTFPQTADGLPLSLNGLPVSRKPWSKLFRGMLRTLPNKIGLPSPAEAPGPQASLVTRRADAVFRRTSSTLFDLWGVPVDPATGKWGRHSGSHDSILRRCRFPPTSEAQKLDFRASAHAYHDGAHRQHLDRGQRGPLDARPGKSPPHTPWSVRAGCELRRALNNGHRDPSRAPVALLRALIARPVLVTRDELRKELWPEDTFVDFERGLKQP